MAELGPNEKAATFLDWLPEQLCKFQRPANDGGIYCLSCGARHPTHGSIAPDPNTKLAAKLANGWKHYTQAPDMTSPVNYIRALEALPVAKFKGLWAIAATRTGYRCFIDLYGEVTGWGDEYNCYLDADGRTVAEAVIGALVQLYDGEHKNG